jgi:hypothetical protein
MPARPVLPDHGRPGASPLQAHHVLSLRSCACNCCLRRDRQGVRSASWPIRSVNCESWPRPGALRLACQQMIRKGAPMAESEKRNTSSRAEGNERANHSAAEGNRPRRGPQRPGGERPAQGRNPSAQSKDQGKQTGRPSRQGSRANSSSSGGQRSPSSQRPRQGSSGGNRGSGGRGRSGQPRGQRQIERSTAAPSGAGPARHPIRARGGSGRGPAQHAHPARDDHRIRELAELMRRSPLTSSKS